MCPSPVFKTAVLGLARLHKQKIWIVCALGCWLPDAPESSMSPLIKKQNLCESRVNLRWNSANRPEGYVSFVCLFSLSRWPLVSCFLQGSGSCGRCSSSSAVSVLTATAGPSWEFNSSRGKEKSIWSLTTALATTLHQCWTSVCLLHFKSHML